MASIDEVVERFTEVPKDVFVKSTEGKFYEGSCGSNYFCEVNSLESFLTGCKCMNGFTKTVYMFDDCPEYVFKIPILDRTELRYYEDKEDYDVHTTYKADVSADVDVNNAVGDYCSREVALYKSALERHIEDYFVDSVCVSLIHGIPLYVSDFCRLIDDDAEKLVGVSDFVLGEFDVPQSVELRFVLDWGIDARDELYDFLDDHGINDLHNDNWGIGCDGKVRILDYSGYFSIIGTGVDSSR